MTRLSNRQFPMLRLFAQAGADYYMTMEEAQRFDQRPFRSMLIQEWISFHRGKGFYLTRKGMEAWGEFRNTEIARKNIHAPITSYFDMANYGVRRRGAA